jgi:hypothetical protein
MHIYSYDRIQLRVHQIQFSIVVLSLLACRSSLRTQRRRSVTFYSKLTSRSVCITIICSYHLWQCKFVGNVLWHLWALNAILWFNMLQFSSDMSHRHPRSDTDIVCTSWPRKQQWPCNWLKKGSGILIRHRRDILCSSNDDDVLHYATKNDKFQFISVCITSWCKGKVFGNWLDCLLIKPRWCGYKVDW